MSSSYKIITVSYTDKLSRDGLSKGSFLVNDGTGTFNHISPSADGQQLISDSTAPNGIRYTIGDEVIGFGITTNAAVAIPGVGSTVYFLNSSSTTEAKSVVLPRCELVSFTISPYRLSGVDGWSTVPTNINGAASDTIDFYYCYIPFSVQNSTSNIEYLSTGNTTPPVTPDFQILGSSINTTGTNFTSFIDTNINLGTTNGDQVFIRMTNNLTVSANPAFHRFQSFALFKTT